MHDLLSVDQEYVVRSIAYALRNLSIDRTNKWSIGEFFHLYLIDALLLNLHGELETRLG